MTVNSGGMLAPGASIESLDVGGALSLNSGSTFAYGLNSTATLSVAADLLNAAGNLDIAAGALLTMVDLAGASTPLALGTKLTLIRHVGRGTTARSIRIWTTNCSRSARTNL